MPMYEFSIIASGLDPEAEHFEAQFYVSGCDDALVSFQKGHIILDFSRKAANLADAITSALNCAAKAGATIDRIEPDPLVSLSDIASRTGMTRAAITQYSKGQRSSGFPAPSARVTSESPLWDWATVAHWLFRHGKLTKDQLIAAELFKEANALLSSNQADVIPERLAKRTQKFEAA